MKKKKAREWCVCERCLDQLEQFMLQMRGSCVHVLADLTTTAYTATKVREVLPKRKAKR